MRILDIDGVERSWIGADFSDLLFRTISEMKINETRDVIQFKTSEGNEFEMRCRSNSHEGVYLHSITKDYENILLNTQILDTYTYSNDPTGGKSWIRKSLNIDTQIWTVYKFTTSKGSVWIRWLSELTVDYTENSFSLKEVSFLKRLNNSIIHRWAL